MKSRFPKLFLLILAPFGFLFGQASASEDFTFQVELTSIRDSGIVKLMEKKYPQFGHIAKQLWRFFLPDHTDSDIIAVFDTDSCLIAPPSLRNLIIAPEKEDEKNTIDKSSMHEVSKMEEVKKHEKYLTEKIETRKREISEELKVSNESEEFIRDSQIMKYRVKTGTKIAYFRLL